MEEMQVNYTPQEIIDLVFSTPELYKLLVPDNIEAYGILWGGSRLFDLTIDESDYDLNIIVSVEDYYKIEQTHKFRPSIYINGIRLHWYYFPINPKFFNFAKYAFYGLEWWTAAALMNLTTKNFLQINNAQKINIFLNNLKNNLPLLKDMLYTKYNGNSQFTDEAVYYLHKKSYLFLCLGSLINNSLDQDREEIIKIKQLTHNINTPNKYNYIPIAPIDAAFVLRICAIFKNWLEN